MSAYEATNANISRIEDLGDERHVELFPRLGHQLKALLGETLEGVGRSPRFEGIASQDPGTGLLHGFCGAEELIPAFDRAWPGDGDELVCCADGDTPDVDHSVLRLEVAADEFERLQDGHRTLDAIDRLPGDLLNGVPVAESADHRPELPLRHMGFTPDGLQPLYHYLDLGGIRVPLHDDDHRTHVILLVGRQG